MVPSALLRLFRVGAFLADVRGSTLPIAAAATAAGLAGAGVAVDVGQVYALQNTLSSAADAAALAAASRLPDGPRARETALDYAARNMPAAEYGEVLVEQDVELGTFDPQDGGFRAGGADAVRVTMRLARDRGNAAGLFFAPVFGIADVELAESAVAGRRPEACVHALSATADKALRLDSNASVTANGCTVQVNSTRSQALDLKSNAVLESAGTCVAGRADVGSSARAVPEPVASCPPAPDPLAALPAPAVGGCTRSGAKLVDSAATLSPGVYCKGLTIDGNSNVRFKPGLYVIKDGPLAVLSNSKITGEEVTIFLTGKGGLLKFDSNASLSLTAPSAGDLEGVLFFQDRGFGGTHDWNGNSRANLSGVVYLPKGKLVSFGKDLLTPLRSCTVFIADQLEFNSDAEVSIDLTASACRGSLPRAIRRSVALLG